MSSSRGRPLPAHPTTGSGSKRGESRHRQFQAQRDAAAANPGPALARQTLAVGGGPFPAIAPSANSSTDSFVSASDFLPPSPTRTPAPIHLTSQDSPASPDRPVSPSIPDSTSSPFPDRVSHLPYVQGGINDDHARYIRRALEDADEPRRPLPSLAEWDRLPASPGTTRYPTPDIASTRPLRQGWGQERPLTPAAVEERSRPAPQAPPTPSSSSTLTSAVIPSPPSPAVLSSPSTDRQASLTPRMGAPIPIRNRPATVEEGPDSDGHSPLVPSPSTWIRLPFSSHEGSVISQEIPAGAAHHESVAPEEVPQAHTVMEVPTRLLHRFPRFTADFQSVMNHIAANRRVTTQFLASLHAWYQELRRWRVVLAEPWVYFWLVSELHIHEMRMGVGSQPELTRHDLIADTLAYAYSDAFGEDPVEPMITFVSAAYGIAFDNEYSHLSPNVEEITDYFTRRQAQYNRLREFIQERQQVREDAAARAQADARNRQRTFQSWTQGSDQVARHVERKTERPNSAALDSFDVLRGDRRRAALATFDAEIESKGHAHPGSLAHASAVLSRYLDDDIGEYNEREEEVPPVPPAPLVPPVPPIPLPPFSDDDDMDSMYGEEAEPYRGPSHVPDDDEDSVISAEIEPDVPVDESTSSFTEHEHPIAALPDSRLQENFSRSHVLASETSTGPSGSPSTPRAAHAERLTPRPFNTANSVYHQRSRERSRSATRPALRLDTHIPSSSTVPRRQVQHQLPRMPAHTTPRFAHASFRDDEVLETRRSYESSINRDQTSITRTVERLSQSRAPASTSRIARLSKKIENLFSGKKDK